MTEDRMGQIALTLIKRQMLKDGIPVGEKRRREILRNAVEIGIPGDELLEFAHSIATAFVEATFGSQKK